MSRPLVSTSRAALAAAMLVGLATACNDSGSNSEDAAGAGQSKEGSSTAPSEKADAKPAPAIGGPAPATIVTRIAGEWPTPEDFVLCSVQVNVTGATEGSWESEAIAGSDIMGFGTIYTALSDDGTQRAEAQAGEGYDDSGTIYSIALVDYEQGVTYSGQVDDTTFDRDAMNLEGISIRDVDLPSNEADGTSVTADITFEC